MNFALFLEMHARGAPEALAVVDRRLRLSWGELDGLASRFASVLLDAGLQAGDRMAIYLPNRAEMVIAFFGALKAGIVAVPLNWRLQGGDLLRLVAHCAPGCVITDDERADDLGLPAEQVMTVGAMARTGSFWERIEGGDERFGSVACQAGAIANLLYTSGTTSVPKAAIHTHGMRVAIAAAMADCFKLSRRDVGLAVSPMFHTSGLSVLSNAIFAGCPLVLLDRWDLGEFLAAIERERVTFMHVIGTIVVDIARASEHHFTRDTTSMRFSWGGGHSMDVETFEAFERRIGGVLLQGYSRTEGGLTYNVLDRARRRFDMNGFPNGNSSEVAVLAAESGARLPAGTIGEIGVRGDGVTPGYWDGEFVRVFNLYEGGWQPTGDLGFIDAAGALHFLGRRDSMIKTGGENVYPAEVESVLLAMPQVADAVVVGLPDNRLGQRVAALIVPAEPGLSAADIDRSCRAALGAFKIPRTVAFADSLPRLGTQKVDLAACRDLLIKAADPGG